MTNGIIIILTKFSSLSTQVVKMKTSDTASGENFINVKFPFQWRKNILKLSGKFEPDIQAIL